MPLGSLPLGYFVSSGIIIHRGVYVSFRGEPVVRSTVYGRFAPPPESYAAINGDAPSACSRRCCSFKSTAVFGTPGWAIMHWFAKRLVILAMAIHIVPSAVLAYLLVDGVPIPDAAKVILPSAVVQHR